MINSVDFNLKYKMAIVDDINNKNVKFSKDLYMVRFMSKLQKALNRLKTI